MHNNRSPKYEKRRKLATFATDMQMNRDIIRLAAPNIISNVTVPLMGIASTAIAGHWGTDTAATIGALAIGASIFNFIYWNCSFVRMGTSGLTAQAYGAQDWTECTTMLARALLVAAIIGLLILALQWPLGELALHIMKGDAMTRDYFYARIWAVPAGILLFGFNGWFTGMQNAVIPMATAIVVNLIHIGCSFLFAFGLDQGIVGIAYASVLAQYIGVALSVGLLWGRYGDMLTTIDWRRVVDFEPMRNFFRINRDIMIRTLCNVIVYTFFTAASARMGDAKILAVNTLLMQLFTLFSYMTDGFAYAAEALTGRFIGARDPKRLRLCINRSMLWSVAIALLFVSAYIFGWRDLLTLFVDESDAASGEILALAGQYIAWIVMIPIFCAIPFALDGIMIGATESRVMRNSMVLATIAFFSLYYVGLPLIGNNALWAAFTLYMLCRGAFQYLLTNRLQTLYEKASR